MSVITISVVLGIMIALTFVIFIADLSVYSHPGRLCTFFFFSSLGLTGWLIAANQMPWTIHSKTDVSFSTDTNGIQSIGYETTEGEYKIVNANNLFGRSLSDSMKVKVVQFNPGPYAGVYFLPYTQYILTSSDDKILDVKNSESDPLGKKND